MLTGFFGKLPGRGDFVRRALPREFIDVVDEWLAAALSASQSALGDQWLDAYLGSPIWRFHFHQDAVAPGSWTGLMMPSVDRVGRYYPLIIAASLGDGMPT